MKIFTSQQIREADAYTIEHEPIASIDLMERASSVCVDWLLEMLRDKQPVKIFAGMGNNGGDGLAIARMLCERNFPVTVFLVKHSDRTSEDHAINLQRLKEQGKAEIKEIQEGSDLPELGENDLLIDAMLGSGLSKPAEGLVAKVIGHINEANSIVVAIDIPTGLFGEDNSDNDLEAIVQADYTLSFQQPKLSFMFPEHDRFLGDWQVLSIGLHKDYIENTSTPYNYLLAKDIKQLIKPRLKFSHKGTYGHALLIAGGYGKMGAAILAAKAGLRVGAGLLTAHIPRSGNPIMQSALPEAMVSIDEDEQYFSLHPKLDSYNAIGIGPGIGMEEQTANAIKVLIQNAKQPIVFDADAINILAENKTWIPFIKPGSIFTPHPKEFERLIGKAENGYQRLQLQIEFARKYDSVVILKGAHTCIALPDGTCYFNSTGNPGMAKGGSGDVLTGMILGLLAQGYNFAQASVIGVFLQGLAGDLAKEKHGEEAMLSSDIIAEIGNAYRLVKKG